MDGSFVCIAFSYDGSDFMKKIIIGLTGQSGAGKSTVSCLFERDGFYIINADKVSRKVTSTPEVLSLLKENFGDDIILEIGGLNRRALANIVFTNKEKLQLLNSLLFPIITKEIEKMIDETDKEFVLLDAPQLFESGADKICDKIISVIAPRDMLIERAVERDDISYEEAENRLKSQYSQKFFIDNSNYIIENKTTISDLIDNTLVKIKEIRSSI